MPSTDEEWDALQRHYALTRGTQFLESDLNNLIKHGMTREEAIHQLYQRAFGSSKGLKFNKKTVAVFVVIAVVLASIPSYYFASSIINKPEAGNPAETLIGVEYETWFPYPMGWGLREATPLLGTYNSSDPLIIRQQAEWLTWAGVNFILIDWSNNVWQSSPPSKDNWHNGIAFGIINSTSALLREYNEMTLSGLPHPKVAILVGLDNGPGANVTELNEEAKWIYSNYVEDPVYNQSLLYYEGKPLLVVLDTAMAGGWNDPNFTVRYMGAQLQTQPLIKGYWSWMDGSISPVVTYHDNYPEAVTVTPAFFPPGGWLAPGAYGRRNGATYIQEWNVPLKYKPRFILICQWNEFAGQPNGSSGYYDCYSVQYSNDIEPTQLDGWGYRGDGGWGYYYLVLTKALIDLYRGITPNATVLAISNPIYNSSVSGSVQVQWAYAGEKPSGYSVYLDGRYLASLSPSASSYTLPPLSAGWHTVTIVGEGAYSYFNLTSAWYRLVNETSSPIPAQASLRFYYSG